ncbi:hypothetical protein [Nocardioides jishulii]|uniref:Uncharacterized protein n=1 Tax=Nocardioides jishulii TaxID=2575440 RepID=A0A4U2YRI1_9ACTN|nr:hypothetical protein [Nocardioides jishulii]QCX26115.1 hypothetical protein FCL41_00075 [Nocardioides jishulii]TKI64086.1 hypothetical protein FC770_02635 [Nocardioides jishulii]
MGIGGPSLEGITRGISAFSIDKFALGATRFSDRIEFGILSARAAAFLVSVGVELNVPVAGRAWADRNEHVDR